MGIISEESKVKICKCGHIKDEHKSNPKSKFSLPHECHLCQCSDYMNRKLPNKSSLGMVIYGIVCIGFFISAIVFFYQISIDEKIKNTMIPISTLLIVGSGFFIVMSLMIFNSTIYSFFEEKRRKSFPIDNRGESI